MMTRRLGKLFIVSAPSGAGKTSLVQELIATDPRTKVSISYTTRPKRPGEEHGINYFFVSVEKFQTMIDHDDFLEHAVVFDNLYGTSKSWLIGQLKEGYDIVLDIDWQGYRQIRALFPDSIGIFVLPPSLEELEKRLSHRGQDSAAIIRERMDKAQAEISHFKEYDYIIINKEFAQAGHDLRTIIQADRLKSFRQLEENSVILQQLLYNV